MAKYDYFYETEIEDLECERDCFISLAESLGMDTFELEQDISKRILDFLRHADKNRLSKKFEVLKRAINILMEYNDSYRYLKKMLEDL